MRKIKKNMVILISLLILIGLTSGSFAIAESWNYDHQEYLEVVDLFWSVE
jgi:hypothetical protein